MAQSPLKKTPSFFGSPLSARPLFPAPLRHISALLLRHHIKRCARAEPVRFLGEIPKDWGTKFRGVTGLEWIPALTPGARENLIFHL